MTYYQEKYINLILNDMLMLRNGETLTINCNEETLYFAQDLAKKATDITRVNVNVVYIENGKVSNVVEIEPVTPSHEKPNGNAMVYLASFINPFFTEGEFDAKTLQEFKLLAEPVLPDRQVAIPFATVYVPTLSWAEFLFGEDATLDSVWQILSELFDFDDDFNINVIGQIKELSRRCKYLNSLEIESFELSSYSCNLNLPLAKDTKINSSAIVLANGRSFLQTYPAEDIIIPLDYSKASGNFLTTYPFRLFDSIVTEASFAIENGEIIGYSIPGFEEYLSTLFNLDEDSKKVGELILCDSYTLSSKTYKSLGIPLIDRMRTSHLVLGAITPTCLNNDCDEDNYKESGINASLTRLELPFGSDDLDVYAICKNGDKILIMKDGSFI